MFKVIKGVFWLVALELYLLVLLLFGVVVTFMFCVINLILLSNTWTFLLGAAFYLFYHKIGT